MTRQAFKFVGLACLVVLSGLVSAAVARTADEPQAAEAAKPAASAASGASSHRVSPYVLAAQRRAQESAASGVPVSPLTAPRSHKPAGHARKP